MMKFDEKNNFSGTLYERLGPYVETNDFLISNKIKYIGKISDSNWEEFLFKSKLPLRGEDRYQDIIKSQQTTFEYTLICRRSGPRFLLLSHTKKIVEHVIYEQLKKAFIPPPRYVPIAVNKLVNAITTRPTDFSLGFVHARIPAFGTSLKSTSFYGDDIGDASIFLDNLSLMTCYVCGLRPATGGNEILRLGSDGSISFYLSGPKKVDEVEGVLIFLRKKGYLPTEIIQG